MNLRRQHYPPNYWLNLHKHIQPSIISLPLKQKRQPTRKRLETSLSHLYPFIQKAIYSGAIDRKKGHIRSGKVPIGPEQFCLIARLGGTPQYQQLVQLEDILELRYDFEHEQYHWGVANLQFRLQEQKSVVFGRKLLLLLRFRLQQKHAVLIQWLTVFRLTLSFI